MIEGILIIIINWVKWVELKFGERRRGEEEMNE